ncbi:POTRA domain-containing protein [Flavivirga abyssicola]|uniref:POTRA domain-containing protein n=1 Tax=Flavivirga abyssicola TaxID=3063533 RepID=UPI0026DEC0B0|nr:POTRA domain-containing protein [Flavivirga sp. MEBiC07777]WVK11743.1 POTRA domain-containing protein [Flavivirga sp. MEBiC07777]
MKRVITLVLIFFFAFSYAQENSIYKVDIEGNKRTRTAFLKRLAFVKEGAVLDSAKIASDVRRLKLLPSVANAEYKLESLDKGKYHLTYIIEENFAIIPGLNISTDNNGEFAYRTSIFDFNFLGRNQIIGGFYSRDVFNSYGAFWEAPNLFTRKLGIGLNYQNLVSQEPVFFNNGSDVNYKFNYKAFEIKLQYEPNFHNRLELGLNIDSEAYSFLEGNLPAEIPTSLKANKVSVIGEYEYNNINIFYQYQNGFRSILTYRFVTGNKGEDNLLRNFFIGRNDFEYFKRVGKRGNWANRLRLAYASNDETPFAPFAVDNQLNIRGTGNTIDRGTAAIVLNTEYRQTLYEKGWFVLQGNAFVDTGSWRTPGGDLGELFDGSTIKFYPGLGIRFIHKRIFNAVFRLDYGYGLGDDATNGIVFGIGQYF